MKDFAEEFGIEEVSSDAWKEAFENVPVGDKSGFQHMTFVFSDAQAEIVKAAIKKAKAEGEFDEEENKNSNGNAVARICEAY